MSQNDYKKWYLEFKKWSCSGHFFSIWQEMRSGRIKSFWILILNPTITTKMAKKWLFVALWVSWSTKFEYHSKNSISSGLKFFEFVFLKFGTGIHLRKSHFIVVFFQIFRELMDIAGRCEPRLRFIILKPKKLWTYHHGHKIPPKRFCCIIWIRLINSPAGLFDVSFGVPFFFMWLLVCDHIYRCGGKDGWAYR